MIVHAHRPPAEHSTPQSLGAGRVLLSSKQRRSLALLARKAWEVAGCGETFDDWRHAEVRAETGRAGLTDCENRHYLILRAHWEAMTGDRLAATRHMLRQTREETTWARAQLDRACREAADVLPNAIGYAAGFLRNIRGTTLEAADAKQLRDAFFTIRRRAGQLRRAKSKERRAESEEGNPVSALRPTLSASPAPAVAVAVSPGGSTSNGLKFAILEGGGVSRRDVRTEAGSPIRGDRGGVPQRGGRISPEGGAANGGETPPPTHLRIVPPIRETP